eukprot:jgi/Ulvmu1/2679/UM014_0135.1
MDAELEGLFAELQQVQEHPATVRLSDRMAVDLIGKLKSLDLLGDSLLHTTNGKEYITTERLVDEIYDCLESQGGRVAIVDLPGVLGVDYTHCNAQAQVLLRDKADAVKLINGDLVSHTFFVKMAKEVNEMLLTGVPAVAVTELAQQFSLPLEHVRACLQAHMGSLIDGTLDGSTLYTPAFLGLAKAFLRGTLRAARSPVHVGTILASKPFPHADAVSSQLAASLVQDLRADGAISGSFKAAGLVFCPDAYVNAQVSAATTFFEQTRRIEYTVLSAWGIANAKAFLQEHCPDGIALERAYVSRQLVDEINAAIDAGMPACGFLDAADAVSTEVIDEEVHALAMMSEGVQSCLRQGCMLLAHRYVVSPELLELCRTRAHAAGAAAAERHLLNSVAATTAGVRSNTSPTRGHRGHSTTGRKAGGRGSKGAGNECSPGLTRGAQSAASEGAHTRVHGQGHAEVGAAVHAALLQDCFAGADCPSPELQDAVVEAVSGAALEGYDQRMHKGLAAAAEEDAAAAMENLNHMLQQLVFYSRGVAALRNQAGHGEAVAKELQLLEEHLMRVHGMATADAALSFVAVHVAGCCGAVDLQGLADMERCSLVMQRLPHALRQHAGKVQQALVAGAGASVIAETTRGLLQAAGVNVWDTGAEAEAAAVQLLHQRHFLEMGSKTCHVADAFSKGIVCLVAKHLHRMGPVKQMSTLPRSGPRLHLHEAASLSCTWYGHGM